MTVTYGFAFVTSAYAGVVTDRQISGALIGEVGKCGEVRYRDAKLAYTMAGLAEAPRLGFKTRQWLAEALCDAGAPGVGIDSAIPNFATLATKKIRSLAGVRGEESRLSVLISGFKNSPLGALGIVYLVSNYQAFDLPNVETPWREFRVTKIEATPSSGVLTWIGSAVPTRKILEPAARLLGNPDVPPSHAVESLVDVIRKASDRDRRGEIGKRCSSVVVPLQAGVPSMFDFHPDGPVQKLHVPTSVCAIYGNSGAYIRLDPEVWTHPGSGSDSGDAWAGPAEGGGIEYLGTPTVKRNTPCPCGSGKRYRKCHAKGWRPSEDSPGLYTRGRFMYKALPEDGSDIVVTRL
ncbi:SEC-C metal-binding domain-containing protein [Micromonospora matsumotoense]|uniref:SEC-C metal-binding domain-containing protein n=1 Tax=Micromonospora matsumotoense TaxID=121616 RepID=UPI0033CE20A4